MFNNFQNLNLQTLFQTLHKLYVQSHTCKMRFCDKQKVDKCWTNTFSNFAYKSILSVEIVELIKKNICLYIYCISCINSIKVVPAQFSSIVSYSSVSSFAQKTLCKPTLECFADRISSCIHASFFFRYPSIWKKYCIFFGICIRGVAQNESIKTKARNRRHRRTRKRPCVTRVIVEAKYLAIE